MDIDPHEVEALVFFFDEDDSGDLNLGEFVTIVRYLFKAQRAGLLQAFNLPEEAVEKERARQRGLGCAHGVRDIEIHGKEYVFGPSFSDEVAVRPPPRSSALLGLGGLAARAATLARLSVNKVALSPSSKTSAAEDEEPPPLSLADGDDDSTALAATALAAAHAKAHDALLKPLTKSPSMLFWKEQSSVARLTPDRRRVHPAMPSPVELESRSDALLEEAEGLRAMITEARHAQRWVRTGSRTGGSLGLGGADADGHFLGGSEDHTGAQSPRGPQPPEASLLHLVVDLGGALGHLAAVGATAVAESVAGAARAQFHLAPSHVAPAHRPSESFLAAPQPTPEPKPPKELRQPGGLPEEEEPPQRSRPKKLASSNARSAGESSSSRSPGIPAAFAGLVPFPELTPAQAQSQAPLTDLAGLNRPRRTAFPEVLAGRSFPGLKGAAPSPSKANGFPLQKKKDPKKLRPKALEASELYSSLGLSGSFDNGTIVSKPFVVPAGIDSAVL
jgi:hypothetical protein